MARTEIRSKQIFDDTIIADDIADGAVRGATANGGAQREIALGTVSDIDLRDDAVTPAKLDSSGNFTMSELLLATGTAADPSLSFSADPDTGIYRVGADILGFTTAGTEAVRIDSSQNMGLGGAPVTNGILTLTSTGKAFVPPRMTTAQRDAIGSPSAGMVIYNTDTAALNLYTTSWGGITAVEVDPLSIHLNGDNSPTAAIDWDQQEIQQVVIHTLASDPVSPVEGQIWYNSTVGQWKGKNSTDIVLLG